MRHFAERLLSLEEAEKIVWREPGIGRGISEVEICEYLATHCGERVEFGVILGDSVGNENIYEHALVEAFSKMCFFGQNHRSVVVSHLGVSAVITLLGICALKEKRALDFCRSNFQEFVVIFAHHHEIHVVVPWYKSFVTDSTESGAVGCPYFQIMLFADGEEFGGQD